MAEEDFFAINVSGIDQACAMFDRVPSDVVRLGLIRALAAAAAPIMAAVDRRTPVGTGPTAGKLKRALRADVYLDDDGRGGVASISFGDQGYIANFLEYGHRLVAHAGRQFKNILKESFVAPIFFMRQAAVESSEQAMEAFATELQTALVTETSWAEKESA